MKRILISGAILLFSVSTFAENTSTLPQGRFRARLKPIVSSTVTQSFGEDRHHENVAAEFEVAMDAKLAGLFSTSLAGAMGTLKLDSLGTFVPDLEVNTRVLGSALEYGVTNNLTVGVIVPFVSASSSFSLGFDRSDASFHPALAAVDFESFAQQAEDKAVSKGYHPFGDWKSAGLGDIEAGIKYRFLRTTDWSFATKAGVRLPTGRVDNPDHLTDIGFGDGQTDLGTTLLVDYVGVPNILVNGLVKYTWQLADKEVLRVPLPGEVFALNKEDIERDLGDRLDLAVYTEYQFLSNFNVNATYSYSKKRADRYESALGLDDNTLEVGTSQLKQTANVGVGFSTLPWFRAGTFGVPMDVGAAVSIPVTGRNVAKATTANLEYKLYF